MTAEIITIGDEILIGQIVDTNSAFITEELNKIGIQIRQITSIQDDREHIFSTLKNASQHAEIVIVTGGLGPTNDDITKETLCEFFKDELVLHEESLENITKIFAHSKGPLSDLNRQQAMLPSKAKVLPNSYGTAAGMWFDEGNSAVIALPGVPFEMKELLLTNVIPKLQEQFDLPFIVHKTLAVYGLAESTLADKIAKWENFLPSDIHLAYLPGFGFVRLRLSAWGNDKEFLENTIEEQVLELHKLIGEYIKTYEGTDSLEVQIAKLLITNEKTLSTAESCTGGKIATRFAKNPGASSIYKGSVVSYATESKIEILGVSKKVIDKFSVVSGEVASAMAERSRILFGSDYALATTGNAGPTKGDSDAEVGSVFIALATPEGTTVFDFMFGNHREKVIGKAVNKSLEILLEALQGKYFQNKI